MTNAELALITLLGEQPRHGYEIEQVIEARGMREWTEVGFSSIYYLLSKLEEAGLVEARMEPSPGRGPARKVFSLTTEGRRAAQTGVETALSTPGRCYPPIQLGLANLPGLSPQRAVQALKDYHETMATRKKALLQKRDSQRPLPDFVEAMFSYSETLLDAEMNWIETFAAEWERNHGED
jgi:DNA-binding PadR family transcriptional regulator